MPRKAIWQSDASFIDLQWETTQRARKGRLTTRIAFVRHVEAFRCRWPYESQDSRFYIDHPFRSARQASEPRRFQSFRLTDKHKFVGTWDPVPFPTQNPKRSLLMLGQQLRWSKAKETGPVSGS